MILKAVDKLFNGTIHRHVRLENSDTLKLFPKMLNLINVKEHDTICDPAK
jgi:hypothetical protein